MAQRPSDFPNELEQAMGRRIGMLMAAAEVDTNRGLAALIGVTESQVGKYRRGLYLDSQRRIDSIAQALAGKGDVKDDWKACRDFIQGRTELFPWGDLGYMAWFNNHRLEPALLGLPGLGQVG